jgi:Flp pilus assembly protein TadG
VKPQREGSRGQELVEYALALPIFLMIVMGIVDLGRVVYYNSAIHNSVREGARYGIIYPADWVGIEAAVRNTAIGLNPLDLTVTVSQPDPDSIQVMATYQFTAITPIVANWVGANEWTLGSTSTMWIEG